MIEVYDKTSDIDQGWDNDPEGRIRNLSLAPNPRNAVFPLFEAVMNSIHAIEERFGRDEITKGKVNIDIKRDDSGNVTGFIISDNGVGFTSRNMQSFRRMDSREKEKIGGKGVGRLIWLKVCNSVKVESVFLESSGISRISFDFSIPHPTQFFNYERGVVGDVGTSIHLYPYNSEYQPHLPKKATTVANRLLSHFISYFVNINQPQIYVHDGDVRIDLFEAFTSAIHRDKEYEFADIALDRKFKLNCFLLPKTISDDDKSINAIYLGAHGRAVRRYEMDGVIGMKAISGKYAFLGYVSGSELDDNANDTRTDFSLDYDEISEIVDQAKEKMKNFLEPELKEIRGRQQEIVRLLQIEHPRFLSIRATPEVIAERLHYSTNTPEEVFVELSRMSLRTYQKAKGEYRKSLKADLQTIDVKAKEYVATLQAESTSSLAEYVAKRKLILDVFEESLKFKKIETGTSEYEKVVHDIICPMRSTSDDLDYNDHNLWIIDDRLAFYSYFNSDVKMSKQVKDPEFPLVRPDLSVFDLGLGFESDDKTAPITIIEFKRPKVDNYTLDSNPITQVRKYVEDMRKAGFAMRYDGAPLRSIEANTPFMCQIVADLTPSLREVMKQLGKFHQKAGSNSYYSWDPEYCIFIEISSFHDVLESARSRNRAFFERIGLLS